MSYSLKSLFAFVDLAGRSTYASGKPPEKISQRPGFQEYTFEQRDWGYRDSYTGFTRSTGQEIVTFQGEVVWSNLYCGGMTSGNEILADQTFTFLKKALSAEEASFQSLRGPRSFIEGVWKYTYIQEGSIDNFSGYEQIWHQNNLVFFHRAIGGIVKN